MLAARAEPAASVAWVHLSLCPYGWPHKNLSLLPDFLSVGSDQHPERQRFVVQSSGTLPETRLSNTESFVTPIDMQGVFFLYFS